MGQKKFRVLILHCFLMGKIPFKRSDGLKGFIRTPPIAKQQENNWSYITVSGAKDDVPSPPGAERRSIREAQKMGTERVPSFHVWTLISGRFPFWFVFFSVTQASDRMHIN
ncbi:hypothetical protein GWI33_004722 [Rhynchophorus ferrugineus]|uniref:Uncharacterized protein n=1 Tax=Rhynchophorus ferrugineus TaxID=354439 RepID=A0A834MGL2_RHYFE|nr:hypothetical protein GWI33_004722 [Rhynchophorus ferrugineus]